MDVLVYENDSLKEELIEFIEEWDHIKNWKVYLHISPSNKIYVGITYKELTERWQNGAGYRECPAFWRAINKYGWNNIQHYLLLSELSKKSADRIETYLIQKYKKENRSYNIAKGGEGGTMPEETRKKLSIAEKGKFVSKETREKISKHNLNRGEDWHKKISNAHKKPVLQYNDTGELIKKWDSALDVKKELGIDNSAITLCCNNKRLHAGGYKWKWAENKDVPFCTFDEKKEILRRTKSLLAGHILQYDLNYNLIKEWECLYDILKENPTYKKASICKNLYGKCNSKYGYIWVKKNT